MLAKRTFLTLTGPFDFAFDAADFADLKAPLTPLPAFLVGA